MTSIHLCKFEETWSLSSSSLQPIILTLFSQKVIKSNMVLSYLKNSETLTIRYKLLLKQPNKLVIFNKIFMRVAPVRNLKILHVAMKRLEHWRIREKIGNALIWRPHEHPLHRRWILVWLPVRSVQIFFLIIIKFQFFGKRYFF